MAGSTPLLGGITRKIMMIVPSSFPPLLWKKDRANLLSSSFLKLPSLPSRNISLSSSCSSLPLLLFPSKEDLTRKEEEYEEADEEEDESEEADEEEEEDEEEEDEYEYKYADEEEENHYKFANFCFYSPVEDKFVNVMNRRLPPKISTAVCRGSSNGWLAFINRPDCGIYLVNLFSPDPQIIPLPHIKTLPHVCFRTSEGHHDYRYQLHLRAGLYWLTSYDMSNQVMGKIAMSLNPKEGQNCKVLFINNLLLQDIAFCRIGDMVWTSLGINGIGDILYSKKNQLFYALQHGTIYTLDLSNPDSPTAIGNDVKYLPAYISPQVKANFFVRRGYLVESPEGDLLFVLRYFVNSNGYHDDDDCRPFVPVLYEYSDFEYYNPAWEHNPPCQTAWFTVYKVDLENQIGKPVESLDDTVLFVGCGDSFSVSAKDYPGLRRNSIYFDYDFIDWAALPENLSSRVRDTGVYNLEKHTITPMYPPSESMKIGQVPLWVFSRL